jgi:predicted Zn-dependent protease
MPNTFQDDYRDAFFELADRVSTSLRINEHLTLWFEAEDSDFVRLNHAQIRQPGAVMQRSLTVTLIAGQRQGHLSCTLTGDVPEDTTRALTAVRELRDLVEHSPIDPYINLHESDTTTSAIYPAVMPTSHDMVGQVLGISAGLDLVGYLAAGTVMRGFASSFGQRNWYARPSFNLDWSLYHARDRAVKANYAGFEWDQMTLVESMRSAKNELALVMQTPRTLAPGSYDAYLAPAAVEEIIGLLAWGGFSARARQTHSSPLERLASGRAQLDPRVNLAERGNDGTGPSFSSQGFFKPPEVELLQAGRLGDALCSPRTAKEFDLASNGASSSESPESVFLAPGTLDTEDVLSTLDTGLYISNLWYLNYSDRNACRITGMTRFATAWVEDGVKTTPVSVMRFDESVYALLGEKLADLDSKATLLLSNSTYEGRSTGASTLPGMLIRGLTLTL